MTDHDCPYCDRVFARGEYRDLHLGLDHEGDLTPAERAAYEDALAEEEPRPDDDEDRLGLDERDARGDGGVIETLEPRHEVDGEQHARGDGDQSVPTADPGVTPPAPTGERGERADGERHAIQRLDDVRRVAPAHQDRARADREHRDAEGEEGRNDGVVGRGHGFRIDRRRFTDVDRRGFTLFSDAVYRRINFFKDPLVELFGIIYVVGDMSTLR